MSKRKREDLSVTIQNLNEESSVKKEKKVVSENNISIGSKPIAPDLILIENEKEEVKSGNNNGHREIIESSEPSVSDLILMKNEKKEVKSGNDNSQKETVESVSTVIQNGKTNTKRKRKDEEEDEVERSKKLKLDEKSAKKAKEEEKDKLKKTKAKKVYKKRISKNECLCAPIEKQPEQKIEETDAHIQVEEWRLHKFQSPIELKHDESIHHDHFDPLEFHGHWDDNGDATFSNNGFTATLRFYNRELPLLKGGPLHEDEYVFEQLHFHWSEDDHSGCEHIFEGRAYSMEAHAVHFNQKYKDFKEAQDKPDGLAVVAFFIQATDNEDNPCFSKLSTAVKDIIKINSTTKVPPDCLTWFKEEAQCKGYYTYQGSLTTEPYTESVTWILYPQPLHVSREQVANFRKLHSTPCEQHNIKQNVRPVQTPPEHKKLNVLYARSHRASTSE